MKKIILTIMSAVILLTACKSIQPYTFDSINLEMSTIEVKEALGEPAFELPMINEGEKDINLLSYENQTVFGVDNAYVSIYIDESGVMSAYAQYQNQYVDKGSYLSEYNTIKEKLISILGKPKKIQEDADSFNYRCEWSNNFLTMEKLEDGNVKLWAYVIRSDNISEVTT